MGKDKYENKKYKDADVIIPLSRLEDAILELLDDSDSELYCVLEEIIDKRIPKYFKKCKKQVERKGRRNLCDPETTYHDQEEEEEEEEEV